MLKLMSVTIPTSIKKKSEEAEKLLKQLLECVQDCQKRFGGKTELATEYESCVAGLCVTLDAVLLFGLKNKSSENQNSSTIKQVSEIFAQTLNIGNESPSFWPFVFHHLTKHEQERYIVLKHIWTDTGRGRAWLRSSLNERSLERYFHTLLSNPDILKEYYEPWSILRDEDHNSMLPNMAAGLNSILFAISIDKLELNSGITVRKEAHRCKAELIIEAPIPEKKGNSKQKRKRKVARQFISFEEDDSYLSTSVPSSSSSTASDCISLGESSKTKSPKNSLNQIDEEKFNKTPSKMNTSVEEQNAKIIKNLSIENSGSREKYSTVVPESLTPVTQEEIGELTPVSVEINKNYASPVNSDEILELPTDISAVLSAVEIKNKEEIDKREQKINTLAKENESLKGQVKQYISAIRMLRNDDEEEISEILEGLEAETQPNYKNEAKMFEKKLVQVAEMHAELMDFNVMLQQNLRQKEMLLERLKDELEMLRGPMSTDEFNNDGNFGSVNIWIPSAFLTGSGSGAHHVYQIFLRAGNDEWNIYRRYAQFHALHSDLKKLDPVVGSFDFPPKKSIGKRDSALVEDRRKRFQVYLRRIISHWPELSHCNSRFLLEQHLSFFKDIREDLHHKNVNSRRNVVPQPNNQSGL